MYTAFDKGHPCTIRMFDGMYRGILYGFGTEAWTHGASYTVDGLPAGQESHIRALVEIEGGKLLVLEPSRVTMLDSAKRFNEYAWGEDVD